MKPLEDSSGSIDWTAAVEQLRSQVASLRLTPADFRGLWKAYAALLMARKYPERWSIVTGQLDRWLAAPVQPGRFQPLKRWVEILALQDPRAREDAILDLSAEGCRLRWVSPLNPLFGDERERHRAMLAFNASLEMAKPLVQYLDRPEPEHL